MYFTWPDRRFRYECRGCGACCKGHGIGIDVAGGQLVQLLARRPALAAFLRRRGDAITAFNPRDRCWFLADDGLCRIEVEDGRAAKPASCRLFPFNRVFRLGAYTIVDYNSVICPLTVGDDGITHASIIDELASITDPTIIDTPLPARDPDAEARAFINTERTIAGAIFAAPGDLGVRDAAARDDLQRADHAVVVDDGVRADAEHAVEREQPARCRLRGAAVLDLDAAQAVVGEEPAAVARVEGGDGVAAAAKEGGEGGAARQQLDELAAGDVDADAVALAARAAAAAFVAEPAFRPREVQMLRRRRGHAA